MLTLRQQYSKEIRKNPLLTKEEEKKYGTVIQNAIIESFGSLPQKGSPLTPKQITDIKKDPAVKHAWNSMLKGNLRFVVRIAQKHRYKGLPFLDLVQEGNIGLNVAVGKFDPERGFTFLTMAEHWIEQEITRAIGDHGRTIRIPIHLRQEIEKLKRTNKELTKKLERAATTKELAQELQKTKEEVEYLLKLAASPIELDAPVKKGRETATTKLDFFIEGESNTKVDPADIIEQKDLIKNLPFYVDQLKDERKQGVLYHRFGLRGYNTHTFKEIGIDMGLTWEQVRAIQLKTAKQLKELINGNTLPPSSLHKLKTEEVGPADKFLNLPKRSSPTKTELKQLFNDVINNSGDWDRLLENLEDNQREILSLFSKEGLTIKSIAKKQNTFPSKISLIIVDSLKELIDSWERQKTFQENMPHTPQRKKEDLTLTA